MIAKAIWYSACICTVLGLAWRNPGPGSVCPFFLLNSPASACLSCSKTFMQTLSGRNVCGLPCWCQVSGQKDERERHLNLPVICCPTAGGRVLECTVKRRLYFGPFPTHSCLITLEMLLRGLLRVNRMGKWWNSPRTWLYRIIRPGIVEVGGISVSEILYKIFLFPVSSLFYIFQQK